MPPNPNSFDVAQPDGKKVKVRLRGAVHFNWLEDTNGFPVIRTDQGFEYAEVTKERKLRSTGLKVGDVNPQRAGLKKGVLPSPHNETSGKVGRFLELNGSYGGDKNAQPFGNVRNLVVLMRFADHEERELPSREDIDVLFNAQGGDEERAPTGSVRDYYWENSYGQLTLESTVLPWITLPESEAYYAQGESGMGPRFKQALSDALDLVESLVDFSQFDQDQNGWIDAITFLHSGYAAEWGADDASGTAREDRVWSHRSGMPTWTSSEGVRVMDYNVSSALWGISGSRLTRIGVIAHEMGHFFGLPDLYDTDGSSPGIGSWCGMANAWGWSGDQYYPPQFSAYCKVKLGWVKPLIVAAPGDYFLDPVETLPVVAMITNGFRAREYLLLENRQPLGFDSEIEWGGLAVWHVDEAKYNNDEEGYPGQPGWPQNNQHYRVALLQADGEYGLERNRNQGDAGDLFLGGTGALLNPETAPGTDAYSGGNIARTPIWIRMLPSERNAVGFSYQMARPSAYIRAVALNAGAFELSISGQPGTSCTVQSSEDLLQWSTFFTTAIPASGGTNIVDAIPDASLQRFYRMAP